MRPSVLSEEIASSHRICVSGAFASSNAQNLQGRSNVLTHFDQIPWFYCVGDIMIKISKLEVKLNARKLLYALQTPVVTWFISLIGFYQWDSMKISFRLSLPSFESCTKWSAFGVKWTSVWSRVACLTKLVFKNEMEGLMEVPIHLHGRIDVSVLTRLKKWLVNLIALVIFVRLLVYCPYHRGTFGWSQRTEPTSVTYPFIPAFCPKDILFNKWWVPQLTYKSL